MRKRERKFAWIGGVALFIILLAIIVILPSLFESNYKPGLSLAEVPAPLVEEKRDFFVVTHLVTPESLKALYMTSCVAGTPSWRMTLKQLIETTELNAVVIDIKDYTGTVAFPNNFPRLNGSKGCVVSDLREFIGELHKSNIYVIGRISVFQDVSYTTLFPELAVKSLLTGGIWRDYKGISFIDVGAKPYWDYILDISQQAYALGFDELNYDYVRYPSDGNMQDTNHSWSNASSTRAEILEGFFSYLHDNLSGTGVKTSADLFGMTTTVTTDMGIGQVLERALPYFDYIAPMVYPSHYPKTWNGFANPAEYPYEVVKIAMTRAVEREQAWRISNNFATSTPSKMRPWLQDFNLGATYGPDKVRAQIQATYDSGLTSWMLWSAANKYTESALLSE